MSHIRWEGQTSYCLFEVWVVKCIRAYQVLHPMSMAHPNQASSLQGLHGVNCAALAVKDLGIGEGWQQSTQNQALLAVMGH